MHAYDVYNMVDLTKYNDTAKWNILLFGEEVCNDEETFPAPDISYNNAEV